MNHFFSDMGHSTPVSEIYDRIGESKIDVKRIVVDGESQLNNNQRRISWARRYFEVTGRYPSLNCLEEHECRYCHKPVYYPKGSNPDALKVFCSDGCESDCHKFGW